MTNWPSGVRASHIQPIWIQWRCDQISRLVQQVSEEVRKIKPQVRISAAVFANYPACREVNGQDWVYWAKQGWVDFLCPMNYTESDTAFAARVTEQLHLVEGRVPLYPGIGVVSSSSTLSADRVAGQIALTRHLGADGFTVFDYGTRISSSIIPALGEGTLSQPALIPETGPRWLRYRTADPRGDLRKTYEVGRWVLVQQISDSKGRGLLTSSLLGSWTPADDHPGAG